MDNVDIQKEQPTTINVFPIKKGRRVLLFLADFFVAFIVSFLLYNIAVYPIFYSVIHYDEIQEQANESKVNINLLLKDSDLLYFNDISTESNDMNVGLSYTFDLYMKDLIVDSYDHDIFYHYFVDIKNDVDTYLDGYVTFGNKYFDVNDDKVILKDSYKTLFNPLLSNKDGLSENGQKEYETMFNKYFLTHYSRILNDLKINGLTKNNISYLDEQHYLDVANEKFDTMVVASSFISFFLGFAISYIIVPLTNQYRKTVGMIVLKIQRIDIDSMRILSAKKCSLLSIYNVFTNLMYVCFLPLISISIEYIFNLTFSLWLSIAAILICLASLIVLLIKKSNQTLIDSVTHTAYISDDSLDEIFRARGYYI